MARRIHVFFYWLAVKTWVRLMVAFAARKDVQGLENVPREGPVIMTANHLSNGDPPVITAVMPRRIAWMVKREWFDTPLAGWLLGLHGMIPVRRYEADLKALRVATRELAAGGMLGMFPEGTRGGAGGLREAEPGTALLALRTGAPILPVAIWGTENVKLPRDIFRRTSVHIRIGPPFTLPKSKRVTREQIAEGTREIMERIAQMLPENLRGAYGGKTAVAPGDKEH